MKMPGGRWGGVAMWGAIAASVFAVVWWGRTLPLVEWLEFLRHHAVAMGPWALVLTAVLFAVGCIFFLPTTLLVVTAGAAFGLVWGFVAIWIGYGIAVGVVWMVGARFSGLMRRRFAGVAPRSGAILDALGERGAWLVFLTQLHPLFPAALLNYLYPSLGLSWRTSIPAIMLGRGPTLAMYVALGAFSAKGLLAEAEGKAWLWWVSLAGAVALCAVLARLVSRAIHDATVLEKEGGHPLEEETGHSK